MCVSCLYNELLLAASTRTTLECPPAPVPVTRPLAAGINIHAYEASRPGLCVCVWEAACLPLRIMHIFTEKEIGNLIDALPSETVLSAMADGFKAYSAGQVSVAPIQTLGQPPLANFIGHKDAQACIKSAYLNGGEHFVAKVASGGGGLNSGLMLIFSQRNFAPVAILCDGGLLTELRTAAAGALAFRHLAPSTVSQIAVIGCGIQARWQLRLIASVTGCRHVCTWARRKEQATAFAAEMRELGWTVTVCASAQHACSAAEVVLTVTPAREP